MKRCSIGCWRVRITDIGGPDTGSIFPAFAESHGFEHDYDRPTAYHFRDFVIRRSTLILPFNTFVRWQLAGDELAPHDSLAMMATGFLAAGVHSTQITKNEVEKQRYDELDDMLATTGTAVLGLSVGCARCHDHKFDPIPQADYYRCCPRSRRPSAAKSIFRSVRKGPTLAKVLVASEGLPAIRLHSQGDDFFKADVSSCGGETSTKNKARPRSDYLQVLDAVARRGKALVRHAAGRIAHLVSPHGPCRLDHRSRIAGPASSSRG